MVLADALQSINCRGHLAAVTTAAGLHARVEVTATGGYGLAARTSIRVTMTDDKGRITTRHPRTVDAAAALAAAWVLA
jgi:hypothetical protein